MSGERNHVFTSCKLLKTENGESSSQHNDNSYVNVETKMIQREGTEFFAQSDDLKDAKHTITVCCKKTLYKNLI
jgi:hypothetical protein